MFSIKDTIDSHIQTATKIYYNDLIRENIKAAGWLIASAFQNHHRLFICGNGGSAADSQHLSGELIPMGLPAMSLTTDTSAMTAISNDLNFEHIFAKQIEALGRHGDVLLGISTSGQSMNVRYAIAQAHMQGLSTIALTGNDGMVSKVSQPTIYIKVPSRDTQRIQEAHTLIIHILWKLIEENLREHLAVQHHNN